MAVYKEERTNIWRVIYRYTDWNGERKQSQKRGFPTKREAQAWEQEQLNQKTGDPDMTSVSLEVIMISLSIRMYLPVSKAVPSA